MVYDSVYHGLTVTMRSVEERDAEATLQMRLNNNVNKYLNKVEDSLDKQLQYIRAQRQKPGDYLFIAEDMDGAAIGMRGICDVDIEKGTCETGRLIGLGNPAQNTEITMFGYDFAFYTLGVSKVVMTVIEANANVLNGQRRFGAVEVGRRFMPEWNCDMIISELKKDDYEKIRPSIYRLIDRMSEHRSSGEGKDGQ